ncbi:hypothetical protein RUM43_001615 [Polyplax serrata]|uniref:Uncharacterized protein n=1 Tax=Polyplax serrata TaxID=468196 RepID=A0AAN8XQJ3_POLSC
MQTKNNNQQQLQPASEKLNDEESHPMERPALPPRRNGVVVLAHERYEGKKDILVRNSGIKNGDMRISSLDIKGLGRIATVGFNFESEMFFILNILSGTAPGVLWGFMDASFTVEGSLFGGIIGELFHINGLLAGIKPQKGLTIDLEGVGCILGNTPFEMPTARPRKIFQQEMSLNLLSLVTIDLSCLSDV